MAEVACMCQKSCTFRWEYPSSGGVRSRRDESLRAGLETRLCVTFKAFCLSVSLSWSVWPACQVLRCHVEGLSRPLRLTVTGTCVGAPASRDVYHVTTSVRQRETRTLPVSNQTSSVTYNLRPVIDGTEHFSGPETLTVPPSSTRNYDLSYHPLTMTTDGKKHTVHSHSHRTFVHYIVLRGGAAAGRSTCDWQVAGLIPSRSVFT